MYFKITITKFCDFYIAILLTHFLPNSTALKIVSEKLENIKSTKSNPSLLEEYLRSDETDFKDVVGMTVDTLLAGIDTVIYCNIYYG